MSSQKTREYEVEVTGLKLSKPFFKFFARKISDKLPVEEARRVFSESLGINGFNFRSSDLCLVKIDQDSFERCKILQINRFEERATVLLIDCGINAKVPLSKLRILRDPEECMTSASKYREFFLAGLKLRDNITSLSAEDVKKKILSLHDELVRNCGRRALILRIVAAGSDVGNGIQIADLYTDRNWEKSFVENFLQSDDSLIERVPLHNQTIMLRNLRNAIANHTGVRFEQPIDDSADSMNNSCNNRKLVLITENYGVKSFYVRWNDANNEFHEMQCLLNSLSGDLEPFRFFPLPKIGQRCLVVQDGRNFRGAIESVTNNLKTSSSWYDVRIILIDTGKKINITNQHQRNQVKRLPLNFESFPPLAKHFQLAGVDSAEDSEWGMENNEIRLNFIFHMLTKGHTLQLEIKESVDTSLIQKCVLYHNGVDINEKIRDYNLHTIKLGEQKSLEKSRKYKIDCVYVVSPKLFSIQLFDEKEKIERLQNKLNTFDSPCAVDVRINDLVIVKTINMKMRGLVKSLPTANSNIFQVYAVDYGFTEDTTSHEMHMISEELASFPPMAYKCCLKGFRGFSEEDMKKRTRQEFSTIRNMETAFLEVKEVSKNGLHIVDLKTKDHESLSAYLINQNEEENDEENLSGHTLKAKNGEEIMRESFIESPGKIDDAKIVNSTVKGATDTETGKTRRGINYDMSNSSSSSGVSSAINEHEIMKVTEVTTARDFTMQRLSCIQKYKMFSKKVDDEARMAPNLIDYVVGNTCIAFSSFESKWARAKIIDVSAGDENDFLVVVKSIDDGTKFCVTQREDLKEINLKLHQVDPFAIRCSLPIEFDKIAEGSLSNMIFNFSDNQEYKCLQLAALKDIIFVELFKDSENLVENYVQNGYCKRIHVVPKGMAKVIDVASVTNFIIRMESSQETMQSIKKAAGNCTWSNQTVKHIKINGLYFAELKEGRWARARVTGKSLNAINEFNTYFIDYGQTGVKKDFQEILSRDILSIPPQAIKCSLANVSDKVDFQKVDKHFKDIIIGEKNVVKVEMIEPGVDSAKVDIDVQGKSLCETLFGSTSSNGNDHGKKERSWHWDT